MNQLATTGIVLGRTEYGEADRIITILTPDHGKLRLMAKGVRRVKSKLAGGIELFSVSDIMFIRGRGNIGTLVSTRLIRHYGHIINDLTRVQLGYDLIRLLNKNTEDESGAEYFGLLDHALRALDAAEIHTDLIRVWFSAQLLRLDGFVPNLHTNTAGGRLDALAIYTFSMDDMAFALSEHGRFGADHIKFLRLLFGDYTPAALQRLHVEPELMDMCIPLVQAMFSTSLRI